MTPSFSKIAGLIFQKQKIKASYYDEKIKSYDHEKFIVTESLYNRFVDFLQLNESNT